MPLVLQLHEPQTIKTQGSFGTVEEKRFFPVEDAKFTVNGAAYAHDRGPRCRMFGKFAVTEGVPEDFWHKWMEQTGKYHPAVKNGLIFAMPDLDRLEGQATDLKAHTKVTGLDRLDPNNLPVLDPAHLVTTGDDTPAEVKAQLRNINPEA
jgi:hypothetical protein